MSKRHAEVWITGIGLLSSLGEGIEVHRAALANAQPVTDTERFAPYTIHPLAEPDWSAQIARRDMRQMEPWQRIGTYAAGLALDDAGAKGAGDELVSRMDMIVAAGGGERDIEVDESILTQARETRNVEAMMAERLSSDLRPTLFLAQLSNLLAGNISIVHKVTGSSRTFMGEEGAGVAAVQSAHARIAAGQSDIVLVGGAFNAQRADMLLQFELGQFLTRDGFAPVAERVGDGGVALGSVGAFLVLESAAHAGERGARAHGVLSTVLADYGMEDGRSERIAHLLRDAHAGEAGLIVSGASGTAKAREAEQQGLGGADVSLTPRFVGDMVGHGVEAQFPAAVAFAALGLGEGGAVATTVGPWRSEGVARLDPPHDASKT